MVVLLAKYEKYLVEQSLAVKIQGIYNLTHSVLKFF